MPTRTFSIFEGLDPKVLNMLFEKTKDMIEGQTIKLTNLIADSTTQLWQKMARALAQRPGWGEKYAQSITMKPAVGGSAIASVYTDESGGLGLYVNIVEKGIRTWSIKDALLSGKAAMRNWMKYGTIFVRVPFRWRTPIKKGSLRAGTKQSSIFTDVLPMDIYQAVKGGARLKGAEYGHYAGMVRVEKPLHYQYFTFRTVSMKSKGWQYPAVAPGNVYESVLQKVKPMVQYMVDDYVKKFVVDLKKTLEKEVKR